MRVRILSVAFRALVLAPALAACLGAALGCTKDVCVRGEVGCGCAEGGTCSADGAECIDGECRYSSTAGNQSDGGGADSQLDGSKAGGGGSAGSGAGGAAAGGNGGGGGASDSGGASGASGAGGAPGSGGDASLGCQAGSCPENATCNDSAGAIVCACKPSYYDAGGSCEIDPCKPLDGGAPCRPDQACHVESGSAACTCPGELTECGGACVDTDASESHCGQCDYACARGSSCTNGACEPLVHEVIVAPFRSCALLESSTGAYPVQCWGDGNWGFYRDGSGTESTRPRNVVGVAAARALAMSAERVCYLMPDEDTVRCWGSCIKECGHSSSPGSYTAFGEIGVSNVDGLAAARGQIPSLGGTCARSDGSSLLCWGYRNFIMDTIDRSSPTGLPVGSTDSYPSFIDVSGHAYHLCGATSDHRVACWGYPDETLLGAAPPDPATDYAPYVQREGGGDLTGAVSVSAGFSVSCALLQNGKVSCWGDNSSGLLGVGGASAHAGAVEVPTLSDIVDVSVGAANACAVDSSGQAFCWGYANTIGLLDGKNADGESGDYPSDPSDPNRYFTTPQPLPTLTDALDVACTNGHCCSRRRNADVVCWGANDYGELGDGSKILREVPTPVDFGL